MHSPILVASHHREQPLDIAFPDRAATHAVWSDVCRRFSGSVGTDERDWPAAVQCYYAVAAADISYLVLLCAEVSSQSLDFCAQSAYHADRLTNR